MEVAFLETYFDNKRYIQWPEGNVELGFLTPEERDSTCVRLERSMYGNVDAALHWLREFKKFLVNDCGFVECVVDPFILFFEENKKLLIVISIHVDDSMVAGRKDDLTDSGAFKANKFVQHIRDHNQKK